MGRGFSQLQRKILCLALKKKFVTCGEMLTEFWGLLPQEGKSKEARYASAHATLSRSLTRLWSRGLLEYWRTLTHNRTAVILTDEGKRLAQAIFTEDQKEQFKG
jgi:DNA-binding MarR family transcriptional regulator